MRCEKAGCKREATMNVELHSDDGDMQWEACKQHAKAFAEWVKNESEIQGAEWILVWSESAPQSTPSP
jgi:hypothetical protein